MVSSSAAGFSAWLLLVTEQISRFIGQYSTKYGGFIDLRRFAARCLDGNRVLVYDARNGRDQDRLSVPARRVGVTAVVGPLLTLALHTRVLIVYLAFATESWTMAGSQRGVGASSHRIIAEPSTGAKCYDTLLHV